MNDVEYLTGENSSLAAENRRLAAENRRLRAALSAIVGVVEVNVPELIADADTRPAESPDLPEAAAG